MLNHPPETENNYVTTRPATCRAFIRVSQKIHLLVRWKNNSMTIHEAEVLFHFMSDIINNNKVFKCGAGRKKTISSQIMGEMRSYYTR
jgi:hypothetical protein